MPAIARALTKDRIVTGHLCNGIAPIAGVKQTAVTVNGFPIAVTGDLVQVHNLKEGRSCRPHTAIVTATSISVTAGGFPVCRIGDPSDLGAVKSGSPTVMVGL